MSKLLIGALKPTPTGLAFLSAALLAFRNHLQRSSYAKLFVLLILFLNRGNLPLRWHLKLFGIGLKARWRYDKGRLGLLKANAIQKNLQLKGGELGLNGIGTNVFDMLTVRKTRVSFAESDYNLHLSNSNYAQAGDFARMQCASDYFGVIATEDGINALLGGSTFVYFREIPMFANYTTESRVVAFDDRWAYFLTRFIIPYDKKSKRAPSKSLETGEDCTVCAFLLSRLTFKRGRVGTSPEKGLALAGIVGPAETDLGCNWRLAKELRRQKGVKAWMQKTEDAGQYLKGCEERNAKALEIVGRLHDSDRMAWMELDEA